MAAKNKLDIVSSEVQVQAAEKADFKEVHPSGLPLTLPTAPTLSEESNPEPAASEQKAAATDSAWIEQLQNFFPPHRSHLYSSLGSCSLE